MSKSPISPDFFTHRFFSQSEQAAATLFKPLIDAVLPPRCAGCNDWHDGLFCPRCTSFLHPIIAPLCARCGSPFDRAARVLPNSICADCRDNRYHSAPPIDASRAIYAFEGPMREAIHRFKYHRRTSLARPLARLIFAAWNHDYVAIPRDIDWIVPVPLQAWRQWRRGYNQSELLARELSHLSQVPHDGVLWRRRHTRSQIEVSQRERQSNVRGAFDIAVDSTSIAGRSILLIDDVRTTGATLDECARVLRRHRARAVYALTLARRL